ncbi:unnamed protein product [Symbiodinium sp. CCMP2592]|nr:unnamed protein product [Symbiodinium sp. CCMP2592]
MDDLPKMLESYWDNFKQLHPTHQIFNLQVPLSRCLPVLLHGDEGTTYKRDGALVLSFQSPLGRGTSKNKVGNVAGDNKQLLNFVGHAFQSRFLIVAGLKEDYRNNPDIYKQYLELATASLDDACRQGVQLQSGQMLHLVPVGLKGDWSFLAIMVYFLINYDSTPEGTSGPAVLSGDRFMDFMKWFTLIYTSILWKALVSWSLITPTAAPWLEEVKTWWAAVVGTAFFVNIHVVLQVPFTAEIWRWVVYALLALLQMLMSAVVQRTVPMVMGALGAFVVAWKIGFEVSEALQFGSREVQYLTTFAIIGLEGVGIILAAIAFARNRDKVQDWVRGLLCCGPCQKKTQPED